MTHHLTSDPDADTIRTFITQERGMRQQVFKRNVSRLAAKVTECDMALKALDRLQERIATLERQAQQPSLLNAANEDHTTA